MLQTKYIETLLHRFRLEDCKPMATPMETCLHLSIHDLGDYFDVSFSINRLWDALSMYALRDRTFSMQFHRMRRFMHSLGAKHW